MPKRTATSGQRPTVGKNQQKPGCLGWGCLGLVVLTVLGGCGALVKAAGGDGGTKADTSASAVALPSHSPSPSVPPRTVSYRLPNFTGQHLDQVESTLTAHGIKWDNGYGDQYDNPDQLGPADYYVCTQSPAAGAVLQTGNGHSPIVKVTVVGLDVNCDGSLKTDGTSSTGGVIGGSDSSGTSDGSTSDGSSGTTGSVAGAGATALCNDGTYSYSAHHRGTCSHHGGVAVWYK